MGKTTKVPPLRVFFFDNFGTTVAQIPPVADELWKAARESLESDASSISSEVRIKAANMSREDWAEFATEWNGEEEKFRRESLEDHGFLDWKEVDEKRIKALPRLLAHRGLVLLSEDTDRSDSRNAIGSLWNSSQLDHLAHVWHRLTPWPDACRGLSLLNKKFSTVALSNTYNDLLKGLVKHSSIPFTDVISADMFNSYKPNPKVYLGAAEKMGVKPEECALVAAHFSDLKGAKACGFYAIYVERPAEEKNPKLREDDIPDMVINEDENGFITLAERLGIQVD